MKKISDFLFKNFLFLEVKISIYLNRRVFVIGLITELPRYYLFFFFFFFFLYKVGNRLKCRLMHLLQWLYQLTS